MDASQILQALISIEKAVSHYKIKQKRINDKIGLRVAELETIAQGYKMQLDDLLKKSKDYDKNGEPMILIEGSSVDYVIRYSTPTGRTVVDPDAVPDEFCKIERKPILSEIKKHIETNPVNWARIEFGRPEVTWKPKKK